MNRAAAAALFALLAFAANSVLCRMALRMNDCARSVALAAMPVHTEPHSRCANGTMVRL